MKVATSTAGQLGVAVVASPKRNRLSAADKFFCVVLVSILSITRVSATENRVSDLKPNEFFQGPQLQLAEAIHALDVESVKRLARDRKSVV